MDSSLDVPGPKRPNFFSAVGAIVHRSLQRPLRLRIRSSSKSSADSSSRTSSEHSRSSSCLNHRHTPSDRAALRRRCETPDGGDYLSMNQLETVWQYQDSYIGSAAAPLPSAKREYPDAVEVPTLIRHKRSYEMVPQTHIDREDGRRSPGPNEAMVVDGMVHPAFRSTPNLQLTQQSMEAPRKQRPSRFEPPRAYGGAF